MTLLSNPTTGDEPIVRLIDRNLVHKVLRGDSGVPSKWVLPLPALHEAAPLHMVRKLRDTIAAAGDSVLADRLTELIGSVERQPAMDWDRLNVAREDARLLQRWAGMADARSPLLESLSEALRELHGSSDPRVIRARYARGVLADADLLLPGIYQALVSVLDRYTGRSGA